MADRHDGRPAAGRGRRLDELQAGDLEVRASFRVSYDSLDSSRQRADPARIFRLLGLWQGQRISLPAAAALSGGRAEDVAGALEELVDASLLESPEPDWYQLHDLLRLFAVERAQAEETREARDEAVSRLLQWYLAMATVAADLLSPHRYRTPEDDPTLPGPPPGSATDALAWYDGERENVIAAIRQAAAARLPDLAWRSPPHCSRSFSGVTTGPTASPRTGSRSAAPARPGCARGRPERCRTSAPASPRSARWKLSRALGGIRHLAGDGRPVGEAQITISITFACYKLRGPQEAYGHSLRGLELLRNAGNPALLGLGLTTTVTSAGCSAGRTREPSASGKRSRSGRPSGEELDRRTRWRTSAALPGIRPAARGDRQPVRGTPPPGGGRAPGGAGRRTEVPRRGTASYRPNGPGPGVA